MNEDLTYDRCRELANSATRDIANALLSHAEHDHWGDDCGDYFNAAVDQLRWLSETLIDTDPTDVIADFTKLLNSTRDELEYPALGFEYGYADHHTEISDLCRMNKDEGE